VQVQMLKACDGAVVFGAPAIPASHYMAPSMTPSRRSASGDQPVFLDVATAPEVAHLPPVYSWHKAVLKL
jgi:hypothetical protein